MDIQGFFTKKGLLLAAKLAAGSTLKYTRACAGAAETALTASALSQIKQILSMGSPRRNGETAVVPVTLEAGQASGAYTLKEVGLYAQDPDDGEILYKVYRLTEPVKIDPSSRLVLRFYLEETVSQDLNVTVVRASAGLLTEADLDPIYARLDAASAPSRTVEVTAANLRSYILGLPRLLTEDLTVEVSSGAVNSNGLLVYNFYGPGRLTVRAKETGKVNCPYVIQADNCAIPITIEGFTVTSTGGMGTLIRVINSSFVVMNKCSVEGNKTLYPEQTGVGAAYNGTMYMTGCSVSNFHSGIYADHGATLIAKDCTGEGNYYGIAATNGGTAFLEGTTPELMGGTANRRESGLIIKNNGTILQ